MNETDIQKFIRQTETDLQLAKDFLAMWQRRNIDTHLSDMQPPIVGQSLRAPETSAMQPGEYGANKQSLLKAIANCPSEYTIKDVEKALEKMGSPLARPSISQGISRLARKQEISLLRKGVGRQPAVYRKE